MINDYYKVLVSTLPRCIVVLPIWAMVHWHGLVDATLAQLPDDNIIMADRAAARQTCQIVNAPSGNAGVSFTTEAEGWWREGVGT